ncbi:helicase associated domain-containing protein [Streptomyces sp. NRRL F-2580]|uniref:helicase associated domain-containing protein n=1 Tax=Streptomyces sp. NRRL F-2580 TaxID=1463841 RepID=UPI001F1C01B2|nr:helicase associated domain-containing protein [Streptomyces sp. NRRL F-2580]
MKKAPRARRAAAKTATATGPRAGGEAFQKGLQALAQYIAREGALPGRAVVERLPDGTEHRTGIWIGNQKARRDRLDATQLAALAELGVDWARRVGSGPVVLLPPERSGHRASPTHALSARAGPRP